MERVRASTIVTKAEMVLTLLLIKRVGTSSSVQYLMDINKEKNEAVHFSRGINFQTHINSLFNGEQWGITFCVETVSHASDSD